MRARLRPVPINGLFDSTPDADANKAVDFALTWHYSLGNRVWRDVNNNGSVDAADGATPGVDGVKVRLFYANGSPDEAERQRGLLHSFLRAGQHMASMLTGIFHGIH